MTLQAIGRTSVGLLLLPATLWAAPVAPAAGASNGSAWPAAPENSAAAPTPAQTLPTQAVPPSGPVQQTAPQTAPAAPPADANNAVQPAPAGPPPVQYVAVPIGQAPGYVVVETPQAEPAPTGDPASIRNHDGFYLRMNIGVGYLWDNFKAKNSPTEYTIRGSAMPLEILLGGTLFPGFVMGGGLWLSPGLQFRLESDSVSRELQSDHSLMFAQFGPFVDYYFDPKQGLHALAAFTFAQLSVDGDSTYSSSEMVDASGYALTAGLGQDFWIGKQWSAGILGRFTYASLSETQSGTEYTHQVLTPALLATFTLH